MSKINLARALRLKNRLAQQLREAQAEVVNGNLYWNNSKPAEDINALLKKRIDIMNRLVALKAAIDKANEPIRDAIYRLAELKGYATMLGQIPTVDEDNEKASATMRSPLTAANHPAVWRVNQKTRAEWNAMKELVHNEIEHLQGVLEIHNGKTHIEVED